MLLSTMSRAKQGTTYRMGSQKIAAIHRLKWTYLLTVLISAPGRGRTGFATVSGATGAGCAAQ